MVRLLVLALAAVAVRLAWGAVRALLTRPGPASPGGGGRAGTPGKADLDRRGKLVGCARCGLHVPEGRAVNRDGSAYCSDTCATAGGTGADA